jgi:hypothetical protein
VTALKWLWAPAHYWPVWMAVTLSTFLLREIWALASRQTGATLSDWVWGQLHIVSRESITQWSAADLLLFAVYLIVFVGWLPWHLWFRKFT